MAEDNGGIFPYRVIVEYDRHRQEEEKQQQEAIRRRQEEQRRKKQNQQAEHSRPRQNPNPAQSKPKQGNTYYGNGYDPSAAFGSVNFPNVEMPDSGNAAGFNDSARKKTSSAFSQYDKQFDDILSGRAYAGTNQNGGNFQRHSNPNNSYRNAQSSPQQRRQEQNPQRKTVQNTPRRNESAQSSQQRSSRKKQANNSAFGNSRPNTRPMPKQGNRYDPPFEQTQYDSSYSNSSTSRPQSSRQPVRRVASQDGIDRPKSKHQTGANIPKNDQFGNGTTETKAKKQKAKKLSKQPGLSSPKKGIENQRPPKPAKANRPQNEKPSKKQIKRQNRRNDENEEVRNSKQGADKTRGEISKKKRANRRIAIVAVIASIFLVACAAVGVYLVNTKLVISEFIVNNSEQATYSIDQIKSDSGVQEGDSLLFVSKNKVKNILVEKLPYIGTVKVEKQMPNTLVLKIEETADTFCIENGDEQIWVDENDKVLSSTKKKLEGGQISVKGVFTSKVNYEIGEKLKFESITNSAEDRKAMKENEKRYKVLKNIYEGVKKSNVKIKEVDYVSDYKIIMRYKSNFYIYAKPTNDFVKNFERLKEILKETGSIKDVYHFDMRTNSNIYHGYGQMSL